MLRNQSVWLIAAAIAAPLWCRGADRDLMDLSRDVAGIQDQLSQLRTAADQKTTKLDDLLQQLVKSLAKVNASLDAVGKTAGQPLSPAQTGVGSMADLGAQLDSMRDATGALRASFADINNRMNTLQQRLSDVSNALGQVGAQQAGMAPTGTAPAATASAAPSGMSAETLYHNALRDESSGNYDLALAEFGDYLKYFGSTDTAGGAQFETGQIYYKQKQFDKALRAFGLVTAEYPSSDRAADAYYMEGMALLKLGRPLQAADAFRQVVKKYPASNAAEQAKLQLQNLSQGK